MLIRYSSSRLDTLLSAAISISVNSAIISENQHFNMFRNSKTKIILIIFFTLLIGTGVFAQSQQFFVDPSYDLKGRSQILATLQKTGPNLYFYIDEDWWLNFDSQKRGEVLEAIRSLSSEFDNKIYPTLTATFGPEWKPGIDNDERITILFHPMKKEAGGYFNSGNEYTKFENPESNQREMVYLNTNYIDSPLVRSFLTHEFIHLITFNQKEKLRGISEEVWLNEARAEYSPTLLGYDSPFQGSNLEKRIKTFLANPSDSLTEWRSEEADYGGLNLFTQYLVEKYGIQILIDSLKSKETGISALNSALKKNGFSEDFSQIFSDWLITVYLNNCSLSEKYCYKNENLKGVRVAPSLIFLPLEGETTLSTTYLTKEWAGNWYKIIGGQKGIKLEFSGFPGVKFQVAYLLEDKKGIISIDFLKLNDSQKGEISLPDFAGNITSITLIPSIQSKISDFSDKEPFYTFSLKISALKSEEEEIKLIDQLLARIEELKKQIAEYQSKINTLLAKQRPALCQKIENNLYFGLINNFEVRCLQEFLKNQGPEIYPEGLITGNFLSLTQKAVIRFQEKYTTEILAPLGLERGTGYVGPQTRAKLNALLGR